MTDQFQPIGSKRKRPHERVFKGKVWMLVWLTDYQPVWAWKQCLWLHQLVRNGWNQRCVDDGTTVRRSLCWSWCISVTDKQALERINNFEFCLNWFTLTVIKLWNLEYLFK